MVEDVEAVRNALGLGKISLLGHSYGGVLAQAYALKYKRISAISSWPPLPFDQRDERGPRAREVAPGYLWRS